MKKAIEVAKFLYSGESVEVEALRKQINSLHTKAASVNQTLLAVIAVIQNRLAEIDTINHELSLLSRTLESTLRALGEERI